MRYEPTEYDLKINLAEILKIIWNINTHSDNDVECMLFEEWLINFAKMKWEDDFVDFDLAIQKIKDTDKTFIDFDSIYIFDTSQTLKILRCLLCDFKFSRWTKKNIMLIFWTCLNLTLWKKNV